MSPLLWPISIDLGAINPSHKQVTSGSKTFDYSMNFWDPKIYDYFWDVKVYDESRFDEPFFWPFIAFITDVWWKK